MTQGSPHTQRPVSMTGAQALPHQLLPYTVYPFLSVLWPQSAAVGTPSSPLPPLSTVPPPFTSPPRVSSFIYPSGFLNQCLQPQPWASLELYPGQSMDSGCVPRSELSETLPAFFSRVSPTSGKGLVSSVCTATIKHSVHLILQCPVHIYSI